MPRKVRVLMIDCEEHRLDAFVDSLTPDDSLEWRPLDNVEGVLTELDEGVDAIFSPATLSEYLLRDEPPIPMMMGPEGSLGMQGFPSLPPEPVAITHPSAEIREESGWRGKFLRFAESSRDGVFRFELSESPRFTYLNPSMSRLLNCPLQALQDDPLFATRFFSRGDIDRLRRVVRQLVAPQSVEVELCLQDAEKRWAELCLIPVFDVDGALSAVEGFLRPRATPKPSASLTPKTQTAEHLWDWDLKNNHVTLSERWQEKMGFSCGELNGNPSRWFARVHDDDRARLIGNLRSYLDSDFEAHEDEYRLRCPDGTHRWMSLHAIALRDVVGVPYRINGTQLDITDRKKKLRQLRHDTSHDALTGLPGRALLEDRLTRLLQQSLPPFALMLVGLDHFEALNNALGHCIGDRLLAALAERLKRALGPSDLLARYSKDSFAIIAEDPCVRGDSREIAEQVLTSIAEPLLLDGHEIHLSASLGLIFRQEKETSATMLLRDVQEGLLKARVSGHSRQVVYV